MNSSLIYKTLLKEKVKGKDLTVKTFLTFDNKNLILQLSTNNMLVEKTYPNTKIGKNNIKKFVSKFKNGKDIQKYLSK